jgi:hypothetical protein
MRMEWMLRQNTITRKAFIYYSNYDCIIPFQPEMGVFGKLKRNK